MANLTTAIGRENEIFQKEDITFGYDSAITNIVTALNTFLSGSEKNIAIGGKVKSYSGMNIQVEPVFAINSSEKMCCIDTEIISPIPVEESDVSENRIDIVEIKSEYVEYDIKDRKFKDPVIDTEITDSVTTKKKLAVTVIVKKGNAGSSVAPDTDEGYVKIAEITIPAAVNTISDSFIHNVTAIKEGENNVSWTNEQDATFNPGFVYDLLPKFYNSHLDDGTLKSGIIKENNINFGVGTNQVRGRVIPNGESIDIHGVGYNNNESIAFMITKLADAASELFKYSNDTLSRYRFSSVVAAAASTENVDLSVGGGKSIDGVNCSTGMVVLLRNQTVPSENGLYKVGSPWVRHESYDESKPESLRNTLFFISGGTTNAGKVYYCNNDLVTVGRDDIYFSESFFSSQGKSNTVMVRDNNGRSKVTDPAESKDIANKGWVEGITGLLSNLGTAVKTNIVAALNEVRTSLVNAVTWDSTNKKITKTIGSTTSDVVTASTLKTAMALNNVPNMSKQGIFNMVHPVGEIFIQYPSIGSFTTKTPMQLYNTNGITSTWVELDFDGAFFRANGGLAQNFNGQTTPQSDEIKSHYHDSIQLEGNPSTWIGYANFLYPGFGQSAYLSYKDGTKLITSNAGGNETRPTNFTIKVWLRTA